MRLLSRFIFLPLICAMAIAATSCNKEEETKEESNGGSKGGGNGASGVTVSGNVGGHDYVDLGLPSGTKWATCNVGAMKPEEYGDYFAWGETKTKETSKLDVYVKCSDLKAQGVIDANGSLTARYDAATVNWGNDWRMPTEDELYELLTLDNEYAEVNGVKGRKFIGKGNSLFLPFAGEGRWDDTAGKFGYYWSASASEDLLDACYLIGNLIVKSEKAFREGYHPEGEFSVRPVLSKK